MREILKRLFKKRIILFHIDEEGRDFITAKSFSEVGRRENFLIIFSTRQTAKLYKFFKIDKYIDTLIIPKPYFLYLYTSEFKHSVFSLLPTEALGYISYSKKAIRDSFVPFGEKFNESNIEKFSKLFALHFAWGEEVKESIEAITPLKNVKMFTVGHPRYYKQNVPRSKDKVTSICRNRKLRIGFSSRWDSLNSYNFVHSHSLMRAIVFNINGMKWLSDKEISSGIGITERLHKDVQDVRNMFSLINLIKDNELLDLSFRPHPRESIENWKAIAKDFNSDKINWCLDICNESFITWLNSLDILISTPSTTFYDCLFLGVYPISIDKLVEGREKLLPYHWDDTNKINKHISRPSTLNEIQELINSITKNYNSYVPDFWSKDKLKSINGEVDMNKSSKSIEIIVEKIDQELPRHKLGNIRYIYIYPIMFFIEVLGIFGNLLIEIKRKRSSGYWFFSVKEHLKIYK